MWKNILLEDTEAIDAYLQGLKGVRSLYASSNGNDVEPYIRDKKDAECWMYEGDQFQIGMLFCFMEYQGYHTILNYWIDGDAADAEQMLTLSIEKAQDYLSRNNGTTLRYYQPKDLLGINKIMTTTFIIPIMQKYFSKAYVESEDDKYNLIVVEL